MLDHFIMYVVKPWDDLNALLAKPLALEPTMSEITRQARLIAVELRHLAELVSAGDETMARSIDADFRSRSPACDVMRDVGDAAKHGTLGQKARQNRIATYAQLELDESRQRARFLGNQIEVTHTGRGTLDFMVYSRAAIRFWLEEHFRSVIPNRSDDILVCEQPYSDEVVLEFDPKFIVNCASLRVRMGVRGVNLKFEAAEPANTIWLKVVEYVVPPYAVVGTQKQALCRARAPLGT